MMLRIDGCFLVFDVRIKWEEDLIKSGLNGVNYIDSVFRFRFLGWSITGFLYLFRIRRLKKMVMSFDCFFCWVCFFVCTGRMGLVGVGSISFVVIIRVVWRVILKFLWVVLGNLLEDIKSRIRLREKGFDLLIYIYKWVREFGIEVYESFKFYN